MSNRFFKGVLLGSTVIAGAAGLAAPAFAQDRPPAPVREKGTSMPAPDAPPPGTQGTPTPTGAPGPEAGVQSQDSSGAAAENSQGDIVVTGTLIKNPNLVSSSPVAVIGQEEIQLRQSNVAEQILRDIPGTVPSVGSAVNNGNGGASFVNLRGLGSNRNIVLLDGTRIVPADLTGRVDLNNIPLALVERTEVLTGGASTTYGADAISGVINFITRSDFAGAELNASEQITQRGDGNTFRVDATVGANFDDGRGNAVFSIGYQQSDPVYQGERPFSQFQIDSFSGRPGGSGTTVPARFGGLRGSPTRQIDANGALVPTFATFNFNPFNIFQTPFERFNIYGAGHYDVADKISVYTQGLFSKNTVSTILAPSGTFGTSFTVPFSNPFLPAAARTQICTANSLTVEQCAAAAAATSPTDPNYRTFTTTISRRLVEAGPRQSEFTTTLFNYRLGVRGDITSSLGFDIYGAYGQSANDQRSTGTELFSRTQQALLATNANTCLTNTNGCVPLNVFGQEGSITPAQVAFISVPTTASTNTSLGQIRGVINGDFGVASPFAANPIGIAVGGEYRRYTANTRSDLLSQTPGEVLGSGAASPDSSGKYDVYEEFAEINAPLIEDRPFFKRLTLEAGVRHSKYSTAGSNTTYKVGGSWEPVSALKVRGNYQKAVRAPNIGELFSPTVTGLDNFSADPCAGAAPVNNATLRAVCLAQGAPATSIGNIENDPAGQINVTSGGNPNLDVEKAKTYTIGAVFQPDFFKNFVITVDYYNIKVKGAITTPTPGDVFAACNANLSPTSPACTGIRRNPSTGTLFGDPSTTPGIPEPLSNLGKLFTDGVDVTANFRTPLPFLNAKLNLSFLGNYTRSSKFQATPTSPNRECTGYYSVNCASIQPKYSFNQRTTLSFHNVDLSLLWRYIHKVKQEPLDADPVEGNGPAFSGPLTGTVAFLGNRNFGRIGAKSYFDLAARFGVSENFDLTITGMNIFDLKPPLTGATVGSTAFNSGNTYPSTYDPLGRRFAVGARLKF